MDDVPIPTSLGDYLDLQRGNTYKSSLLGLPGPILLGLASIARNGGFKSDNLKTYGGHSDPRMLLEPGDIYVSLKDVTQSADLLGAVSRVPENIEQGRLTQDTVKLTFKTKNAPKDYIYWSLRTPQYREYCRAHATGTTNLGLPREDFLSFPIPPLTPARADLVALLQALDDKIDINRRLNETLEAVVRAIFKDWFLDFGPTRAKMNGGAPYLATEFWALFPDRLDDDGKPNGWKHSTVGAEFRLTMGQSPPGDSYNETGDGLPFFQGRTDFGVRYPKRRMFCNAPTRVAESDDTMVSVRAPVGDLNMAWERCCVGRGVSAVRHRSGHRGYTYYAMSHLQPELAAFEHTGTVFGAINKAQFEALKTTAPNRRVVDAFEEFASTLDEHIRFNEIESTTLASTRDLLLPKLISGEIRVKAAAKVVEAVA